MKESQSPKTYDMMETSSEWVIGTRFNTFADRGVALLGLVTNWVKLKSKQSSRKTDLKDVLCCPSFNCIILSSSLWTKGQCKTAIELKTHFVLVSSTGILWRPPLKRLHDCAGCWNEMAECSSKMNWRPSFLFSRNWLRSSCWLSLRCSWINNFS